MAHAWAEVHANTPEGGSSASPVHEERYRQWSQFAFDPSEPAVNGGESGNG